MELVKKGLPEFPAKETQALFLKGKTFPMGRRAMLMGILNVTPDSFSDGGKYFRPEEAVRHLEMLLEAGADFVDVGGESTRPWAEPVSAKEEIRRILPVLETWQGRKPDAVLSIDTSKSEVAGAALRHGALLVNDVTALRGDPRMADTIARYQAGVVLMHMKGTPQTMQDNPTYQDLMGEIRHFFEERIQQALRAGIREDSIILDPGLGFGKTVDHNLEILRRLQSFKAFGKPLLVGPSRKSFIGHVLDLPVEKRLFGTAAAVCIAILNGADMVRIHDVSEMKQVARMVDAVQKGYGV